jgi:hypothetical protein
MAHRRIPEKMLAVEIPSPIIVPAHFTSSKPVGKEKLALATE